MSYILHLDTSTDVCGVAVSRDGEVVTCLTTNADRNHAAIINQQIHAALADASITMADIDAVAVCSGPGSYTGLRIAMATAKGICYATDKPLILNDRLSLLIDKLRKKYEDANMSYLALLKAREGEYFVALTEGENTVLEPQHMMEDMLVKALHEQNKINVISDLSEEEINKLKVNFQTIEPGSNIDYSSWANKAYLSYVDKMFVNTAMAKPLYLK